MLFRQYCTIDLNTHILRLSQRANHDIFDEQQLNNLDLSLIVSKTYTNMSEVLVGKELELLLQFKKQTMSIHEFFVLGLVRILLLFKESYTDNGLGLTNDSMVIANFLESSFVLIFGQKELRVLVGDSIE